MHKLPHNESSNLPQIGSSIQLWRDQFFWWTLAFTTFAILPFVQRGYFWGANDARHHVYFLYEFNRSVQDGIWWPRWSPDFAFGYGYPFFNIYAPFSHFLAEILCFFLGFGFTQSIETIFGVSIIGSAVTMYLFVRTWAGRQAALVSALVYVYIPYHLLNLYVRGNLTESMSFIWLPLCLWTARGSVVDGTLHKRVSWMLGLAMSYAGLMLTSNMVIVLFTPLLTVYILMLLITYTEAQSFGQRIRQWIQRGVMPALGGLLGLGLSAIFWIPAFIERRDVREDQWFDGRYSFQDHFVYVSQLFRLEWGMGASQAGPYDPISFQIGLVPLILVPGGLILFWRSLKNQPSGKKQSWEILCFLIVGLVAIGVALTWFSPLWKLPFIGTILGFAQFPWRWFSISSLCLSILAGLVLHPAIQLIPKSLNRVVAGLPLVVWGIVAFILISSAPMLYVEIEEPAEGPVGLAALMRFQRSADEMTGSTRWVSEIPTWSPMAEYYINQTKAGKEGLAVKPVDTKVDYTNATNYKRDGITLGSMRHNTVMEEVFFATVDDTHSITFNHFFYPGWKAYLLDGPNGRPVEELPVIPESEGTLGRMTVPVPAGEGFVLLRFEDTPSRRIGKQVTMGTIGVVVILLIGLFITQNRRTFIH
ncbi:MAG: hypothetical protein AAF639_23575 [Chloroflexota bacterium]